MYQPIRSQQKRKLQKQKFVSEFLVVYGPSKPLILFLGKPKTIKKIPAKSTEIPKDVPYLLIGGGTAAFSAFRAIKSADPKAKVISLIQYL